jgi:hypothetical protein
MVMVDQCVGPAKLYDADPTLVTHDVCVDTVCRDKDSGAPDTSIVVDTGVAVAHSRHHGWSQYPITVWVVNQYSKR